MLELTLSIPNYFFIPLEGDLLSEYNKGFSLGEIFKVKNVGILTQADELLINTNLDKLKVNIDKYMRGESQIKVGEFTKSKGVDLDGIYKSIPYRPFDNRYLYDSKLVSARRLNSIKHEQIELNMYLNFTASVRDNNFYKHFSITSKTPDVNYFTGKSQVHTAPLYILNEQNKIESNIKESFIKEINNCVGDTENILNI